MVKGKISRVGELRTFLKDFSDDSFVYLSITEQGAALIAETEIDGTGSLMISSKEILVPSNTNELTQSQIKRMENFFD